MVIAKSFSRIFFCDAINIGLSVIEFQEGIDAMDKGAPVSINFENGTVIHEGNEYHFPALPKEVLAILKYGGLVPHVRKELAKPEPALHVLSMDLWGNLSGLVIC